MLDLVTQKKETEHAIAQYDMEINSLKNELETYVNTQKRYNDLITRNQYLRAIVNNIDMILAEDSGIPPAEDPWAPLVNQ